MKEKVPFFLSSLSIAQAGGVFSRLRRGSKRRELAQECMNCEKKLMLGCSNASLGSSNRFVLSRVFFLQPPDSRYRMEKEGNYLLITIIVVD